MGARGRGRRTFKDEADLVDYCGDGLNLEATCAMYDPRPISHHPQTSLGDFEAALIAGRSGSEDSCSSLLETMMDAFTYCQMVYDEEGLLLDWIHLAVNPAFVRLLGVEDIVGRKMTDVFPGAADSASQLFETCGRVAAGGPAERFEFEFQPRSLWLDIAVSSPGLGYFVAVFEDITQRRKMEAALGLFQLSLDCSADMIHWMTADGRIVYASDSSVKRTGRSREELLGLTIFDLDPAMTPEAWLAHWRELKAAGSLSFATVHITKGGEVFPVEVTANYMEHDGEEYNFAFTRDVTDRRRLESALRLTQVSVDRAADLIHWVDAEGSLLYVSDSTCLRHGYSREELLGMTIFDLDPMQTRTTWTEHWHELRQQGSLSFESVHVTKAGEAFPVDVVGNYVRVGKDEYNFVFARDVSRRKRAEQDLHKAKAALETQNRDLEEAGRQLEAANQELREVRDSLAVQARTDSLTGCLNRGALLSRLDEELVRADRDKSVIAVGMLDIDHFKDINDTFGHPVGDRVLCEVVSRSLGALRPYDVFGRFGGEEFLLVVPGIEAGLAREVFERVRRAIEAEPVLVEGEKIRVTVSIGGVVRETEASDALIRMADDALYVAKAQGRNRVEMAEAPARGGSVPFEESPNRLS